MFVMQLSDKSQVYYLANECRSSLVLDLRSYLEYTDPPIFFINKKDWPNICAILEEFYTKGKRKDEISTN